MILEAGTSAFRFQASSFKDLTGIVSCHNVIRFVGARLFGTRYLSDLDG